MLLLLLLIKSNLISNLLATEDRRQWPEPMSKFVFVYACWAPAGRYICRVLDQTKGIDSRTMKKPRTIDNGVRMPSAFQSETVRIRHYKRAITYEESIHTAGMI